jgi:hypothetical protein
MLGAAVSAHGVGARPTPVGTHRRSGRTAWAVAGALILGLLGAGLYIWNRDARQQVADLPTHRQVGGSAVSANSLPKASAAAPAAPEPTADAVPGDAVEGAALEAELAPAQALSPEGAQKTSPGARGAAIIAPGQASPAPNDRTKRARPQPKVQARPDKLIPGDRTKGLSVDEF